MLHCAVTGEAEVPPVIAVPEKEYGLIRKEEGLDSMCFGGQARIGPDGVERV